MPARRGFYTVFARALYRSHTKILPVQGVFSMGFAGSKIKFCSIVDNVQGDYVMLFL